MRIMNYHRVLLTIVMMALISLPYAARATDFAMLYAKISSSVVTIRTRQFDVSRTGVVGRSGIGSGILIGPAQVLTAAHVVEDADQILVFFEDDRKIRATVVSSYPTIDVAMLKLQEPHPNPVLAILGDSDTTAIGAPVFVIGAPYGLERALSVGYLSGRLARGTTDDGIPIHYLQTDTAINPGNSGGPMFDKTGKVIGIVSFILSQSGGYDGVGFAIAINTAYAAMTTSTGYIAGFSGIHLTKRQSYALNIPSEGILIQSVSSGTQAEMFGLKAGTIPALIERKKMLLGGDVILSMECKECSSADRVFSENAIAQAITGKHLVALTVFRDGNIVSLSADNNVISDADTSATVEVDPHHVRTSLPMDTGAVNSFHSARIH